MEENIKITKLPDILNPNKIAEKKILEKYGICPFCGEKKGLVVIIAVVLKVSGIGRLLGMENMIKITINFRG